MDNDWTLGLEDVAVQSRGAGVQPVTMEESNLQLERDQARRDALATLHSVWLYDEDEEARAKVDGSAVYGCYRMPSMRNDAAALYVYGKDYARVAAPELAGEPMGLCERMIAGMEDEGMRKAYQKKYYALRTSGKDTSRSYYGLFGQMVRDDVRARHKAWKDGQQRMVEVQRRNEERFGTLLEMGLDGRAWEFTPEDLDLLQQGGFTLQDMQLLGELYKQAEYDRAQGGVHSVREELNLADMALKLERSGKEKLLTDILMRRLAADAEKHRAKQEESGFWDKGKEVLREVGEAVGKTLMTVQSSLEPTPQDKRGEYRFGLYGLQQKYGIDEDEARLYVEKGRALSGGMRDSREQGVAAARERYGFTGFSAASTLGDLGGFLLQLSNPATASAWFADSVDDKYRRYEYADPEGDQGGHLARAVGYTAGEYAAFRYAPKMVWSGAGRLFGATVGKIGGGAVGRGAGRGLAWMNRSAVGAASVGAVRGVGDVGVIIPGATGALHALYDVMPGVDDELDTGLQELAGLWRQMGRGEYWAETLVTGGAFGLMNVQSWRRSQGLAKARFRELFEDLGGDPAFFEKNKGVPAQDMPELLQKELEREKAEDQGGMLQRAIGVARRKLDALEVQREKADNAVRAMLQLRGYEVVPEDGKFRLYYEGTVEGGVAKRGGKSVLLDEGEVDAFIEMQMDGAARDVAHRMRAAVAKGRMAEALRGMDVRVEWLREGLDGRKAAEAAERARDRVEVRTRELMEERGAGEKEARELALAEVHEDVLDEGTAAWMRDVDGKVPSLAAVISYGEQWARRGAQAEGAGVQAAGSHANVMRRERPDGTLERVLRVALGATPKEVAEELGEQAAVDFMRANGWNTIEAFRVLEHLRRYLRGKGDEALAKASDAILSLHRRNEGLYARVMSDGTKPEDIHALDLAEEREVRAEVIEGLSRLMFSDLLMDELTRNPELPEWARMLGRDLTLDLNEQGEQLALAKGLMDARAEGWLPEAVRKLDGGTEDRARVLVSRAAEAVRGALRGKAEPEPGEYLDALYRAEKAQAELDARFGAGVAVAPERFEAFAEEAREGQKKWDEARAEEEAEAAEKAAGDVAETEEGNPGMSHEEAVRATNEAKNERRQEQIAMSGERDADFVGGVCQTVDGPDGGGLCKLGFLDVGRLEVMSNFKLGSDEETGVVEPLRGDYRADHDPIRVWRRVDGTLVVISGRHRLDACKRAGMGKIISYVYGEDALHDEQWARRFDIESNILDNQATALEVALYVRGEWNDGRALTEEEITRAGIARKGKAGSIGCEIARKGTQGVIDAWRSGQLSEQQAYWIASFMPGNERAQSGGVRAAVSGDVTRTEILAGMETAEALGRMRDEVGAAVEVDLWGNPIDSGDAFEEFVRKYIVRKRNEIGKDLSYIRATATKSNAAEMAKKYGVDVKDPEAMKRKRDELALLQHRWKNPFTDPELMEEIRKAYRKETLEGWAEEAQDEVEEAPVGLPGEAEGQGVFFSRRDTPALLLWRSQMLKLRQQERGVVGGRVDVSMSVRAKGAEAYMKSAERKAFAKAYKAFRAARDKYNSESFALRNSRKAYNKLNWYEGAERFEREREWIDRFTESYEAAERVFVAKQKELEDACAKAMDAMERACFGESWSRVGYADKVMLLKWLLKDGVLTYDEHWAFFNLLLDREEAAEASRGEGVPVEVPEGVHVAAEGAPEVSMSVRGQGVDYVTDRDGNAIPVRDLVERVHRGNKERVAELERDPRYAEVMGKIRDAVSGKITKAFAYRDLNEAEVSFFLNRLRFDLSGYAWQISPKELKSVLKQKKRGKYSFALTEEELGLIPAMIDDIAESGMATVSSNVDAITPGGTVFVKVSNPITRMEMDFRLAPRLDKRKMYTKPDEKKKPKLTLTSARAFLSQGAGLAPAQPPKPVPPSAVDSTPDGGSVKENLLKQEFTSQNTSINKVKTPAVFEMVKKSIGWAKGTVNIDIGGGKYDTLTKALQEVGVTSYIYEPYGRTSNENAYILSQLQRGNMRGDTATCSNVLNVIKESDVRTNVIHQMAKAIKPGGTAYFTIYEGDGKGVGKKSKDDCWQNNRKAETYEDEVRQYFGDVSMRGKLIVARKPLEQDTPAQWRRGGDSDAVVSFSVSPTLREDLTAAYDHRLKADKTIPLCTAPRAFAALGLPMLDIVTTPRILGKVKNKHHMEVDEVERAVHGMDDPLLIIREDEGRYILFPGGMTWSHNGKGDIIAPVRLEVSEDKSHFMTTMYGLDNLQKTKSLLKQGALLYCKYSKAELAASSAPGLSPDLLRLVTESGFTDNTITGDGIVKSGGGKSADEVHFSIFGMTARGAALADERGDTYVDPADGMRKWVVSDAESRLRDSFTFGQLNVPLGGHKDSTLGAILHFPELFRNYPDLAGVRVRLYKPRKPDGCRGYLNPEPGRGEAAYIAVNMGACDSPGQVLKTLRHESQHWIQSAEGHAVGAGVTSLKDAAVYLDLAIKQRKDAGAVDDWSRDNLAYLEGLRARVAAGDERAAEETYFYSHGEQEARYTGEGRGVGGETPEIGGFDGEEPSHYTVAVTQEATELGGVTFAGMGRFGYLLETRLRPSLEFTHDRQVMQMKETVVRMMNQLDMLPDGEAEGLKLAADGLNVLERVTSLLPTSYRMALEPYRLYFTYYSILHGTGNAEYAGSVIPMAGWDKRMTGAMRNMAMQLLEGDVSLSDFGYWMMHPELLKEVQELMDEVRPDWEEALKAAQEEVDDDGSPKAVRAKRVRDRAVFVFGQAHPEYFETMYKALGVIRADKLMGKFLERVALLLEHYRKDRTLGKMRRVVDGVQVAPDKDGKPRKGMMGADAYRHLQDLVALLEMTRSEREAFMELYDGGHEGKKAWEEMEDSELVEVEVYDADGKKKKVAVSKLEFDVYGCYEQMSAEQAESASRALGEFITTGRQAWQNIEEAAKARIGRLCAPLLEGFTETENERRRRELEEMRATGKYKTDMLLNDAQFFDVLAADPDCQGWAGEFVRRISGGHRDIEMWEKGRMRWVQEALGRAAGTTDRRKIREWLDAAKKSRDTGIVLVPREPDFEGEALGEVRRQLFGLLHRKTKQKNFSPNKFAATLEWMSQLGDDVLPRAIKEEMMRKYGRIGDAKKSVLKDEGAAMSLFTEAEYAKFSDVGATVRARVEKARGKWREDHGDKLKDMQDAEAAGEGLVISRMEAAYRVLMAEQADYKEMLHEQGYTAEVVQRLRDFAGKDVMKLAYELRTKLGERTPQMKALYEKMYGVPFPEVENYFRAYFDARNETRENKMLSGEGVGNAAGTGKVKVLYTRVKHNSKLDATMDVLTAFNCAMKEQDVLLAWGQLGGDIRRVLNHRQGGLEMRAALAERFGRDMVHSMLRWADMFDRVCVEPEEVARGMAKLIRALGNASAVTILNGRVGSLVKQATAVFNTLAGSELVSVWEWHQAMGRVMSWSGKISMKEMASRPELDGRFKGWFASIDKEAASQMADVKSGHGATAPWTRVGMDAMEWLDVKANVVSCCVLYDAVYRKLQKADKNLAHEQLDEAAMGEVRRALALKSQPQDFRSRSLLATKQMVTSAGMLFLGGESINTFGNVCRLALKEKGLTKGWGKDGHKRKAAAVWLAHGAMLQVLTFLYNWMTDDKEQWEKRHWWHYVEQSLLGPLMGIPVVSYGVSWVLGGVSEALPKEYRPWFPTQSLLPVGDLSRATGDVRKAFFGKGSSWQDKCIAAENALRTLLTFAAVVYRNPQTPGGGWAKGIAFGGALVANVLDFFLRTDRAFEERALGR